MDILDALNWRTATKKFSYKKLTDAQVETLVEALRLAPSSYGLQAFKFILVKNESLRDRIYGVSHNQSQVKDASHLLVLAQETNYGEKEIDSFAELIRTARNVDNSTISGYVNIIKGTFAKLDEETKNIWLSRQVYLALGVLLTAAAVEGIDACPMEGFDKAKVDEMLGLAELGLTSLVMVPIGYRAEDDNYSKMPKVRKDKEELLIEID